MPGRVLVADDDLLIRKAGERALTRAGFEVATAGSAADALRLAQGYGFEAAILDYYLGGECGCDLVAPLRARNPAIHIAVLSGLGALPDVVDHALRAGADRVGTKTCIRWPDLLGRATAAPAPPPPTVDLGSLRRDLIHGAFLVHGRNVTGTARALGITRTSLQRILRRTPPPLLLEEDE